MNSGSNRMKQGRQVLLLLLAAWPAAAAWAQQGAASAPTATAAAAQKRLCVNAELNGVRSLSYDCLNQQLAPTPTTAPDGSTGNVAEQLVTQPSNRVGTFNESAERIRFGSNWGKSVVPQRPAPLVPVSPVH